MKSPFFVLQALIFCNCFIGSYLQKLVWVSNFNTDESDSWNVTSGNGRFQRLLYSSILTPSQGDYWLISAQGVNKELMPPPVPYYGGKITVQFSAYVLQPSTLTVRFLRDNFNYEQVQASSISIASNGWSSYSVSLNIFQYPSFLVSFIYSSDIRIYLDAIKITIDGSIMSCPTVSSSTRCGFTLDVFSNYGWSFAGTKVDWITTSAFTYLKRDFLYLGGLLKGSINFKAVQNGLSATIQISVNQTSYQQRINSGYTEFDLTASTQYTVGQTYTILITFITTSIRAQLSSLSMNVAGNCSTCNTVLTCSKFTNGVTCACNVNSCPGPNKQCIVSQFNQSADPCSCLPGYTEDSSGNCVVAGTIITDPPTTSVPQTTSMLTTSTTGLDRLIFSCGFENDICGFDTPFNIWKKDNEPLSSPSEQYVQLLPYNGSYYMGQNGCSNLPLTLTLSLSDSSFSVRVKFALYAHGSILSFGLQLYSETMVLLEDDILLTSQYLSSTIPSWKLIDKTYTLASKVLIIQFVAFCTAQLTNLIDYPFSRKIAIDDLNVFSEDVGCGTCHPNGECVTINGVQQCVCLAGFSGDGYTCRDSSAIIDDLITTTQDTKVTRTTATTSTEDTTTSVYTPSTSTTHDTKTTTPTSTNARTTQVPISSDLICPEGWIKYRIYCYLFQNGNSTLPGKSWVDSLLSCLNHGGNLLSVADYAENKFIANYLKNECMENQHFWIGLNALQRAFSWSDKTTSLFFNWRQGQPDNQLEEESCVEANSYGWNDAKCNQLFGFICKIKKELFSCSNDFEYDGYCYEFHIGNASQNGLNWHISLSLCETHKGNLLSVANQAENVFISNHLRSHKMKNFHFWIGLNALQMKFVWSDKTAPFFFDWKYGEPNNSEKKKLCSELSSDGWNADSCDNHFGFICKVKLGCGNANTQCVTDANGVQQCFCGENNGDGYTCTQSGPCWLAANQAKNYNNEVGGFIPQCDQYGNYKSLQLHGSTGYSWCVNVKTGVEIEGTRVGSGGKTPMCDCNGGCKSEFTTCINNECRCLGDYTLINGKCTGIWSDWINDTCSKRCGDGEMTRTRACKNGVYCITDIGEYKKYHIQSIYCNLKICECDGHCTRPFTKCINNEYRCDDNYTMVNKMCTGDWGDWKNSACSHSCGAGLMTRERNCKRGAYCITESGDYKKKQMQSEVYCNLKMCASTTTATPTTAQSTTSKDISCPCLQRYCERFFDEEFCSLVNQLCPKTNCTPTYRPITTTLYTTTTAQPTTTTAETTTTTTQPTTTTAETTTTTTQPTTTTAETTTETPIATTEPSTTTTQPTTTETLTTTTDALTTTDEYTTTTTEALTTIADTTKTTTEDTTTTTEDTTTTSETTPTIAEDTTTTTEDTTTTTEDTTTTSETASTIAEDTTITTEDTTTTTEDTTTTTEDTTTTSETASTIAEDTTTTHT